MAILARPRRALANFIDPGRRVMNAIAQAFMVGGPFTSYDTEAPTYINKGYLHNPVVYSVINQRAQKARSVPLQIKRIKDEQAKKQLDNFRLATNRDIAPNQIIKKLQLETKAFDEVLLDFPMEQPNELQSWGDIKALYETFIAATGNFYLYMLRGEFMTEPQQVYVLPSHLMNIVLKPNAHLLGAESPIDYYRLIEGQVTIRFNAEDVIHIKLPNPEYDMHGRHLYGLSPLRASLRNIQSSNLGLDGNVRTMLNSGAFGFVHGKGPTPLTAEQAESIKSRMQEMDASNERLSKIQGIAGEIGFTQIALTTDQLKPFDFFNFDQKQICNVLGWDDKLLNNDQGAKYDNYQLALKGVVIRTTMPSLTLYEEAITQKFLPMFKGYDGAIAEHDYSELPEMQIDIAEMVGWLKIGIDIGAYNRDEFRHSTGFRMLDTPEMKAFTVQNDVIPLTEAIADDFIINDTQAV